MVKRFLVNRLTLITLSTIFLYTFLSDTFAESTDNAVNLMNKANVIRNVAKEWIEVGIEQHNRGLYQQALNSFSQAQNYLHYLDSQQKDKLYNYLQITIKIISEQQKIDTNLSQAEQLIYQDDISDAKMLLGEIQGNPFLQSDEKERLQQMLQEIHVLLNTRMKQMRQLYLESIESYRKDQLHEAREGFETVANSGLLDLPKGKTPQDYLSKINAFLSNRQEYSHSISSNIESVQDKTAEEPWSTKSAEANTQSLEKAKQELFQTESVLQADEEKQIDSGTENSEIVQSYLKAVLEDTLNQVQKYLSNYDFQSANKAVTRLRLTLTKKRSQLREELFVHYQDIIKKLYEKIEEEKSEGGNFSALAGEIQPFANTEPSGRSRNQIDKNHEIKALNDAAVIYIKEGKYQEALEVLQKLNFLNQQESGI